MIINYKKYLIISCNSLFSLIQIFIQILTICLNICLQIKKKYCVHKIPNKNSKSQFAAILAQDQGPTTNETSSSNPKQTIHHAELMIIWKTISLRDQLTQIWRSYSRLSTLLLNLRINIFEIFCWNYFEIWDCFSWLMFGWNK